MKKGQTVTIYEDPITCQKAEGKARLIELVRQDEGDGLTMWRVKFVDDGFETTRTIKAVQK